MKQLLSLLRATLDSTADGILTVDLDGKIVDFNTRFIQLWRIPPDVVASRIDSRALEFVLSQLKDPKSFLDKVRLLYDHPNDDSFDVLDFKDGRVFERYSRPQIIAGRPEGRVWSFRDVSKQKFIERTLVETASQLQAIFNAAHDGFLVTDAESKRVVFVNPQMCHITGHSEAELLNMTVDNLHPPRDLPFILEQFNRQTREEVEATGNIPVLKKDGSVVLCDVTSALAEIKGRRMLIGIFHDTTERKLREDAIERARLDWERTFDTVSDLIAQIDANHRIIRVNRAMAERLGCVPKQAVGRLCFEIVHGLSAPPDYCPHTKMLANLKVERTVIEEKQLGGTFDVSATPLFNNAGLLVGCIHVARDITESKRAVEALRTSEYWLLESQRVSRVGSYVLDVVSGLWTSSEVLDEIFGIDSNYPRTVDGWADIVHPEQRREMLDYFTIDVLQKKNPFNREYRIVSKNNGQTRWVLGHGTLFFDENNNPIKMVGTIQDVTERKQAEDENMRLVAQVMQAQRLESLGVMAGGLAHDFNNMLMVILGNADLACHDAPAGSPARSRIDCIVDVAKKAGELCAQMLAYSGKGRSTVKPISLSAVVEDMGAMLAVAVSKKTTLRCNFSPDLPAIKADASQVRQVVMNLVINASEAIGDRNGVITIATGCVQCDCNCARDPHLNGIISEGEYVFLEVADTGCGMDADTVKRIFDPFFTTKLTGRGLGLATVLDIMRSHKGAIRIRSEPGHGTTFTALFPTTPACVAALPGKESAPPSSVSDTDAWLGHGVVLLVDDEKDVLDVCRLMLEKLGFEVLSATDGRKAVELYNQHRAHIRCVVLDLTMPDMDGEQAFAELRKSDPSVRVLMSSGYSEQSVANRFAGIGLAGFIQKPYQLAALRAALKTTLG